MSSDLALIGTLAGIGGAVAGVVGLVLAQGRQRAGEQATVQVLLATVERLSREAERNETTVGKLIEAVARLEEQVKTLFGQVKA